MPVVGIGPPAPVLLYNQQPMPVAGAMFVQAQPLIQTQVLPQPSRVIVQEHHHHEAPPAPVVIPPPAQPLTQTENN